MSRPHHALWLDAVAGSLALGLACTPTGATAGTLRGPEAQAIETIDGATLFRPATAPWSPPLSDAAALGRVAADTLRYLNAAAPEPTMSGSLLQDVGVTPEAQRATLEWVVRTAATDPARLRDPAALARCLTPYRWTPDAGRQQVRLTRYLVYDVPGSPVASEARGFALWATPNDEAGLTPAEALARKDTLLRYRYTRQDVAAGVYKAGGASAGAADPLVWLTHAQHEQALLQGTISVTLPDGTRHLYNVDRNNGMPYDRALRDTTQQRRYWYFKEVPAVGGWGEAPTPKIALEPFVAVAGDVYNIGLGTLLLLKTADGLRLTVLADTGGAFQPNLHQLDLYSGVFPDATTFQHATAAIGDNADVWALVYNGC
jgi:hypothetical protein